MVYNDQGEEVINFGKHKGRTVEQVFDMEPSYYAWMKQGDFPLYTKKKLDDIWQRWSKKKEEQKQAKIQNQAAANPTKPNNEPTAKAINNDMLEQLKMKFGK